MLIVYTVPGTVLCIGIKGTLAFMLCAAQWEIHYSLRGCFILLVLLDSYKLSERS
jgi:hypothetical protein